MRVAKMDDPSMLLFDQMGQMPGQHQGGLLLHHNFQK
jgi:hypothetical protein